MPPTFSYFCLVTCWPTQGSGRRTLLPRPWYRSAEVSPARRRKVFTAEQVALSPLPAMAFAIAHEGRRNMQKST